MLARSIPFLLPNVTAPAELKLILTPCKGPICCFGWDRTLTIFYAIASVVSPIALVLRVKVFMQHLRERRSQLVALDKGVQKEHLKKASNPPEVACPDKGQH